MIRTHLDRLTVMSKPFSKFSAYVYLLYLCIAKYYFYTHSYFFQDAHIYFCSIAPTVTCSPLCGQKYVNNLVLFMPKLQPHSWKHIFVQDALSAMRFQLNGTNRLGRVQHEEEGNLSHVHAGASHFCCIIIYSDPYTVMDKVFTGQSFDLKHVTAIWCLVEKLVIHWVLKHSLMYSKAARFRPFLIISFYASKIYLTHNLCYVMKN